MIAFLCSNCGAPLRVKEERAGKSGKCPRCKQMVEAPTESPSGEAIPTAAQAQSTPPEQPSETIPTLPDDISLVNEVSDVFEQESTHSAKDLAFLAPPQGPDELGRLGQYRILKVLGSGGMGIVFQAEDLQLKRQVALKALRADLAVKEEDRRRFIREAQAVAALDHEHIVTVYQVGEDRGIPFLAMKLLQGESLEDRLNNRGGRLPLAEVLRIGREVAEGLAAAHAQGMIHRDIKPANIWLEGDKSWVRIVDFGLARGTHEEGHVTQVGMIVGTPAYMAPEQAGSGPLDHRCDLFSLGCMLYRMSTGRLPFQGKSTLAVLMALAAKTPAAPCSVNPDLPPAFSNFVMKLLRKNRESRPASAKAVVEALKQIEQDLASRRVHPGGLPAAGLNPAARQDEDDEEMAVEEVGEEEAAEKDEEPNEAPARRRERRSHPSIPTRGGRGKGEGPRKKSSKRVEDAESNLERKVMKLAIVVGIAILGLIVYLIVHHIIQKSSEPQSSRPAYFDAAGFGTLNTTSDEPVLPAASRTRSTRTYVPGFNPSVRNLNVSDLLSNRPSVGKTLIHFLPLTANDAAVSRASGERAVASSTT